VKDDVMQPNPGIMLENYPGIVPCFFSYKPPWRLDVPTTFDWVEVSGSSDQDQYRIHTLETPPDTDKG